MKTPTVQLVRAIAAKLIDAGIETEVAANNAINLSVQYKIFAFPMIENYNALIQQKINYLIDGNRSESQCLSSVDENSESTLSHRSLSDSGNDFWLRFIHFKVSFVFLNLLFV